jgi:hypothetical protein
MCKCDNIIIWAHVEYRNVCKGSDTRRYRSNLFSPKTNTLTTINAFDAPVLFFLMLVLLLMFNLCHGGISLGGRPASK